ncbi:MAG: amidohydrolase, partial [Bryobacteraceae bacterium]
VDLNSPPIGAMHSIAGIVEALKKKAASTPEGSWVVGRGYDDTLLADKRHPNRYDLDKVSTRHPIWVVHISGHLGAANSRALAIANITAKTPKPEGGVIRKDPRSGVPDGVLEEAGGMVTRHIPPLTAEQRQASIRRAAEVYLARGVTTAVIAGAAQQALDDLYRAERAGELPLRVVAFGSGSPLTGTSSEMIRISGVKFWQDGSIQGNTGYLEKPYHTPVGDASYRGYARRSRAELAARVKELHRAGYQIAIHGNGDAAIDDIISAYADALKETPRSDARHHIEHCQTVREDQLDAIKELGITPSFFSGHVYYWGDRHRDIFLGPQRAARISPLASAQRRGIPFTLHDDTPVTPVNPLLLVWGAVTRITRDGKLLGPGQRISAMQAMRAVTRDAAWQNFEEKHKGSIEPGKLADLVILTANPLTVTPPEIRDIGVVETIVGGKTAWRR